MMSRKGFVLLLIMMVASFQARALEFYKVIDEPINIRSGPGVSFERLAQAKKNEQVLLIKRQEDWANIFFIHPDGRKVEGWIHSDFISPDGEVRQADSKLKASAIGAQLNCLPNAENTGIGSCLLNIDLTVVGPLTTDTVAVACESELLMHVNNETHPLQESGRIRTPLKQGSGAARMQIIVLPPNQKSIEKMTLVDYRCMAKAL
ncbi:SH3 domain-containing protein [Neptunomonas concharum]|uniref:SH3 domain-containing protein n=1 Tax=Neptunomonas concharum TaxID=1031538 RepID=A0A5P1R9U0_9GAMM|nr:SH3 domain-containing protein [Neptunomonas concharum]QEQ96367.1 SH3 domain-containing protein [Neptunomonas concharum]